LSSGTNYYYRALSFVGSTPSNTYSDTLCVKTLSAAPDLSINNITNKSLNPFWTDTCGSTGYYLEYSTNPILNTIDNSYNTTDTSRNILGLCPNTTYYFRVASINESGQGPYSQIKSATTDADPPTDLSATDISNTSIKLYWTIIDGVSYYKIRQLSSLDPEIIDTSYNTNNNIDNSLNIFDLSYGTIYYYSISAFRPDCSEIYSSAIEILTLSDPPDLSSSAITTVSHRLTWQPMRGAQKYKILCSESSDFSTIDRIYDDIEDISLNVTDLSSGLNYYYKIASKNRSGIDSFSQIHNVLTIPGKPDPIANITSPYSFNTNWNSVRGSSRYNILISRDPGFSNNLYDLSLTDLSQSALDLSEETVYYIRVYARNSSGIGEYVDISALTWADSGITDVSFSPGPSTDLEDYLRNNIPDIYDKDKYCKFIQRNKNKFTNNKANLVASELFPIVDYQFDILPTDPVTYILFQNNDQLNILGGDYNNWKSGNTYYIPGCDGDYLNLNVDGSLYLVQLDGSGIIFDGTKYNIGDSFSPNGDIILTVKLIGSGGLQGSEPGQGIGDPFIKPLFGKAYYMPDDEKTYLLFDNKDNVKIYTKLWHANILREKMSYMRYIIINFGGNLINIDLDNLNFVKLEKQYFENHRLRRLKDEIKYDNLTIKISNQNLVDYYGKKLKISGLNKKMEIIFECGEYKLKLNLISDMAYEDLRNNVTITFIGKISEKEMKKFSGALVNESKMRIIDPEIFFINNKKFE
jgi:hypothetical protein